VPPPAGPDAAAAATALERLKASPPLVFAGEARQLRDSLARVIDGRAFLLQAGDCVESFNELSTTRVREKLKIILQMSAVLTYGARLPVVKVGRIAGQFTKPRSQPFERFGDVELPSFRGHMIHDDARTPEARVPDPSRMVEGYNQSASTLNLLRAFTKGGYADLNQVHLWNQEFVASSPEGRRYERLADEIERALQFMAACGIDLTAERRLHEVDFFTSHEGLLLDYEEGLTRRDSLTGDWYDCSAHLLWIGERTRQIDGAHVEFFAGVHNPLAVKLGPTATPSEVIELCEKLNPDRVPGRLTLVARMGAADVTQLLPPLLRAVVDESHPVVWACDPMHANTITTADGLKTRRFDAVMGEIEGFFGACWEAGVLPGGVHLEFTGEDVTECLGGADDVLEEHLSARYETLCDPRLNARQSLDLAFRLAELMQRAPR
jgi:3-deoxy-7-phosphoheptulonate synthase